MNSKVKINWTEYIKWAQINTMRASATDGSDLPEVVEVLSHNDDGTITVLMGYNDFGTRLVSRVYPESGFVTEITADEPKTETYHNIDERYGDAYPVTIADYIELNPTGNFEERDNGIYEDGEQIAEIRNVS
jgi:hypothetical protein